MSNQIIGNTEYKSIKEKAYINGTQENIMQLATELDKVGINYSGRVSDYRSAITVEARDRARTLEIMKGILNAAKETTPAANAEKNIIGNAEYRFISNKRYVKGETEAMLRTADRLTAENISFSGRINGDTVTLTLSGDEAQELAKKYFAEEKNRIENIQSAYFLALASDTFEDGYYISEVNVNTGEEIAQHRSQFGDISMFISVDSAVRYAEGAGVTLSNTDEQLNEWRRIEIEAEAEKDRQLNLSRSREIIKRLPMTSENDYEEQFVLHENAVDWIYFNPDGANGEGQFVVTTLYADDILNAYIARAATDEHNSQSAFIEIIENGKQTIINADTEDFERYALSFINSRNKDNVIVSAPVVSGNGYDKDFQKIINTLESIFDEVSSYKENHITDISDHITVEGHMGMWYVIDSEEIEGKKLFLLEHEEYGDETTNIIVDENKNLVMEGVYNGFDDYRYSLEYGDDKQFVSRDFAVELWENGFTVFMNDRNNALPNNSDDPNLFDLFTEEKNNTFYAFSNDIVQQRLLDDIVTLLDDLDSAARFEAVEQGKEVGNVADYARDMYEDGDCAYNWRDGLTEWQHISASIRSGNTEYIYAWLRDLQLELPYLKDNRNFSVTEALNHLDNYEKQYMGKLSIDELKKGTRLVYNNTNWEVTHVNNNVLALKNLDSDNEMSSTIIERWQNVVTRSKVDFITDKENLPVENNSQETAGDRSKKTLIINAFGGPGAGKSTACLHITSELKKRGFVAEYVSEYAKDLVWDKNFEMLDGSERHQKMILEEQKRRMDRLIGQVDFVVTDAPILLNSVYLNSDDKSSYDEALVKLFNQYDNFNLEVIRDINNFEKEGRIHNLEQSQQADNDIRALLNKNNIYFGTYSHRNLDKIINNAVVTYSKLSSKPPIVPEIPSRLSVNSPMGNYVPDENLPLSKQLYDLAKMELTNYENSLDTAEKAKAAAYELSVKRDILSYIEYDLSADITDSDVENACRRLISTGYPLDSFYQDWLKNEYDNRMEAIKMTAADTFRKENLHNDYKLKADTKDYVIDGQEGTWSVVNHTEINGRQLFELESDNYGYTPEVGRIIADIDGNVLAENVHNGFENFYTAEKSPVGNTEKNLEFTVITFEDGSVYIEAGKIDDNNITSTSAYAEMLKDNFDPNNIEDLDDNIKVEYAVYHTGDGEAVMPTDEELVEIINRLDNIIEEKEFVSFEESYLHPWEEADDILFDLDKYWQEKSDFSNIFEYEMDKLFYIVPTENLSPISVIEGGIRHYDTLSAVTRIKLKDSDWLDTFDAAVEMNRRGINFDDVELLRTNLAFPEGNYLQKDITPEQFAAYRKKIDDDPQKYEDVIRNYKNYKAKVEKGLAHAQDCLENNLAEVLRHSVAHDELDNISEKIFTDNAEKKIEIAKQYLDNNGFSFELPTDILTKISDNGVIFSLANGYSITYSWSDVAAAYEQAALNNMEWYYTSGRVLEVYNQTLEKDTAVGGGLDVQLDRAVFTDWVSDIIARQNGVKTAFESNDRVLFESTVRSEVDNYFYMLCDKDESISGYNLKDISDFVNNFCTNKELRKEIYTTVAENVDISLGVIEKARETAHNAGLPFREAVADPEEEFNPYAFDGTMSPEDYELMHKLMREDSFEIYQVKSGDKYFFKRFVDLSTLGSPNMSDYDLVYSGKLSEQDITAQSIDEILESVYVKFNNDRPEDFRGRSLSVSDIVVLHKNGEDTAHYVDGIGFKDVPEFLKEKTKELFNEEIMGADGSTKYLISETTDEQHKYNVQILTQGGNGNFYYSGNGRFCETLDEARAFISQDISEREKNNADIPSNSPLGTNEALEKAKQLISDFCDSEYGSTGDFSDLHNVSIAYTTLTDDELPIQVTADLIDFRIIYEFDGKIFDEEKYDSLEEMNEKSLSCLDFDELVSIPFRKLDELTALSDDVFDKSTGMDKSDSPLGTDAIPNKIVFEMFGSGSMYFRDEQMNNLAEISADGIKYYTELSENDKKKVVDKASELFNIEESRQLVPEETKSVEIQKEASLKTVTNQYNSYLIVQDVVYALKDLLNGTADNYDWQNYAEAFNNVLDSNVNTDVALPLYKSGADDILLATAEKKVISADDIAKALSNLELVLQNSHLLQNPEEKVEQISFFSSTPNRTSSEPTQNDKGTSPVGNNPQEEKTEKKTSVDYTITDKNYGTEGGAKTRFANNVEAIKLLKAIEKENRTATPEEQEVLAKYVGWGGIANAFDSRKPDWNKEYNELKSLLTDEEYRAARASTMNAHYTSPTVINAIYSGLENLGFKGGKIIEPAMGIGNFFGAMPDSIHNNSELHGVELDSITGRIAQQLYPSANIQVKGYEDTGFENGSFDVAVGNVPFGSYKLNDKDYNKQNFLIHDYFFAKTLDKVRAGGIVAFVTSKGTLDKESPEVRKYLAERAELLGAIRLPNNTFKSNAGTEVTSDIIFLQKRERPISIEENPPEWIYKDMLPNGIAVNKYFADHPEMILGEMVEGNKLYGNQTDASMCVPIEGANLEEQLVAAIKNITGEYNAAEKGIAENSPVGTDEIPCPPNAPKYSFIVQDDILYYHKSSDTMEKYKAPDKSIEKIKAMAQLRDSVHKLLDLQLENTNGRFDTAISEAQAALNRQYDDFSEKYGLISNSENKMLFRSDNSYHLIKSLEKLDKDGNFIGKADIFSKITINPKVVVDHCDNAQDALILSLSEKMCVNLDYMSILTGKSEEELIAELGDKIYQNPQKFMRWESADEYLTGNIRSKLAAAEAAGLTRNAEALRAVMPERIEAADIAVKLGSAWIDPDYIRQFIVQTLKPDFVTAKNIEVTYMPATDRWKVDGYKKAYSNTLANETYGTYDINAYEIIEATLNMQKVEVKQRVKDEHGNDLRDSKGRYVYEVNQKKTMIAQSKQDELKRMFSDWIFSNPDRREKLVDVYNEKFNSVRLREYDGSHLNFVGMSSAITLKDHQKNAVARGLYSNGNTLLAHEVGAGKTYEMIAIAMEGKRLGLHNKSLITAPNGLTEQWGNAFRTLYPNANVLVATEKDFQKENRRDLFAKIATGDWDAVVIGHSQFDMIHLSRERELDVLHSELDILEEALREMDDGGKKSFSVKQIEKSIRMYEDKIEKLLAKTPEDDMLSFEKLGIDKIFVDESQAYKNLDTPTKMRNVSGIGSGGSGRSMQLLMKCKYLDEITGGKGIVFASGTPISNSMSEMYTLMRYLQSDKLKELGINSFDRWASIFGETVSSMELSPEGNGKYQMKTRFAKFQNLPELMNIFKECADIKTAESLDLDRPDFEMHNVNVPATAIQAMMIKELGERAKEIRAGNVDPTEDNMCKLTVDGRKIGLDQRCMNLNLPDDPKSKVNVCINNVFDIWQKTAAEKSTQLIFCDLATPQPTLNENTYTIFRKNEKGVYSDVYSAKLGERDTAEKIMKKLNGKKPPKNYEAGDVSNGDIIMLKRVNYEEETAYNTAFEVVDGKLTEIAPEMWEKLKHTPVEDFESERRFCVYDDIKQKLIEKGVPEKEIAFIHDVDKAEEKQKLYDKMNKGEIRVLIGSTFKCGAGMNAQERMIALHDLDAPMRPSDMEQRHGRIIRQGNTNSKVDIYRYTTDKTFDAYLYQMLENKQRFISQIMTDKSPVRSCEDVDEVALDYAEVKALCAGNPLIREKIDLETDITKLNVLKSAFLSQKYSLQDKAYKFLPEHRGYTERHIEKLKADIETVKAVKPLTNEDDKKYYPVTVNGKEYHNKEEAGQAIREAIVSNNDIMTNGRERVIGAYRGLEMAIHLEGNAVKVNLKEATSHYGELNLNKDVKASGNIVRLDNIINGMELELQKQEDKLQSLNADIEEAKIAAEATFPQEQELTEKEKRLAEVNTLLADTKVQVDNSMELYAALVEICPELESYDNLSCKYEKGEDSGIEPLIVEKFGDTVFIAHTYVQNGDLMYDPAIEFSFDTQNHRAQALTYELSGLGIYQNFRDGNLSDQKADVEEMALGVMFENIKAYGYERTKFNVDDDRETEKEIRDDSAR